MMLIYQILLGLQHKNYAGVLKTTPPQIAPHKNNIKQWFKIFFQVINLA